MTYPKCPLSKEFVYNQLYNNNIKEYVIAIETHKDGEFHLHVFLKYYSKVEWHKNRWDLIDNGLTYHGNYEGARNWIAVEKYCKKGMNYISNFEIVSKE